MLVLDARTPVSRPPSLRLIPRQAAPATGGTVNRFEEKFWEGARESALAIYEYSNRRNDVPTELRDFIQAVLRQTGEKKNKVFRDAIGLPDDEPEGRRASRLKVEELRA